MRELDSEEREILEAYQTGRLEPIALSREEVEGYRAAATGSQPSRSSSTGSTRRPRRAGPAAASRPIAIISAGVAGTTPGTFQQPTSSIGN